MIIIISEPRSGSTSLYNIFNTYYNFNFLFEPFNKLRQFIELEITGKFYSSNYFLSSIENINKNYGGFKTLVNHLSYDQNQFLINKYKSIYLYRENQYESSLSYCISKQTKNWHDKKILTKNNIIISEIEYKNILEKYLIFLEERKKYYGCLFMSYEDLYINYTGYNKICKYLNINQYDNIDNFIKNGKYTIKKKYNILNVNKIKSIFLETTGRFVDLN